MRNCRPSRLRQSEKRCFVQQITYCIIWEEPAINVQVHPAEKIDVSRGAHTLLLRHLCKDVAQFQVQRMKIGSFFMQTNVIPAKTTQLYNNPYNKYISHYAHQSMMSLAPPIDHRSIPVLSPSRRLPVLEAVGIRRILTSCWNLGGTP